jgi:hypothetical protein
MAEEEAKNPSRLAAATLLARLQSLRGAIEDAAARLSGTAASSRLDAILSQIAGAESEVSQALQSGGPLPFDLTAIERLLSGSEAALSTATAAGAAETAGKATQDLAATSEATRREVQSLSRDLFERRIFDADLKFGSAEEEAAYRTREAERQKQIAEYLAQHTPEGDLLAGGLTAGQMLDAGAHGATANPEFMPRWNRLVEQLQRQRAGMVADNRSPEAIAQFDRQISQDIRRALERKGIPADQIERILSARDPLQAVTPYLGSDSARELEASLSHQRGPQAKPEEGCGTVPPTPVITADRDAVLQMGQGMVTAGIQQGTASPPMTGHGLAEQSRPAEAARLPDRH